MVKRTEENPHAAPKPSIFRSLRAGLVAYGTVMLRNYWHSLFITVTDRLLSRDGGSSFKNSGDNRALKTVKSGIGEAADEARTHTRNFKRNLLDPLAIASAIGITWGHYQSDRKTYMASQERQSLHENSQKAEEQHHKEQMSAEQQHRIQMKDEMRAEVKKEVMKELQQYGIIPPEHSSFADKHGGKSASSHKEREEQRPLAGAGIGTPGG